MKEGAPLAIQFAIRVQHRFHLLFLLMNASKASTSPLCRELAGIRETLMLAGRPPIAKRLPRLFAT
jgi:hypothetical protein